MFRTFERTWWANAACTIPKAGRKRYDGRRFTTETAAREACHRDNVERGPKQRGPRGLATEYESY